MVANSRADDGTRRLEDMYCDYSNLERVVQLIAMYKIIECHEIEYWIKLLYNYWMELCQEAAAEYIAFPGDYMDEHTHPLFYATVKKIYYLRTHPERGNRRDYDPSTAGAPRRQYRDAYQGRKDSYDPLYNPF